MTESSKCAHPLPDKAVDDDYIVIGRIVAAHGIKGWVKVLSFTDPLTNVFDYTPWQLRAATGWQECALIEGRPQGKTLVARIEAIDDRDAALALKGTDIAVPRSRLPKTDENEYYWTDLMGLAVTTTQNVALGRIVQMMETGANDVMVIDGKDRQRLVPFVMDQVVKKVDIGRASVVVDWDPDF